MCFGSAGARNDTCAHISFLRGFRALALRAQESLPFKIWTDTVLIKGYCAICS